MASLAALLLLTWLVALDAHATANRLDRLLIVHEERSEAYLTGVKVSAWCRCLAVAAAGVLALYGFPLALFFFTTGAIYQAILPWQLFMSRFRSGYESRRGSCPPALAAVATAAWMALSRGLPLLLFHLALR